MSHRIKRQCRRGLHFCSFLSSSSALLDANGKLDAIRHSSRRRGPIDLLDTRHQYLDPEHVQYLESPNNSDTGAFYLTRQQVTNTSRLTAKARSLEDILSLAPSPARRNTNAKLPPDPPPWFDLPPNICGSMHVSTARCVPIPDTREVCHIDLAASTSSLNSSAVEIGGSQFFIRAEAWHTLLNGDACGSSSDAVANRWFACMSGFANAMSPHEGFQTLGNAGHC
jgi:hypothetical protein